MGGFLRVLDVLIFGIALGWRDGDREELATPCAASFRLVSSSAIAQRLACLLTRSSAGKQDIHPTLTLHRPDR